MPTSTSTIRSEASLSSDSATGTNISNTGADVHTLCVDCGGGGIKSAVVNSNGDAATTTVRSGVVYPFTPSDLIETVRNHISALNNPDFQRITVGLPGVIRNGNVVFTPHYIRDNGPHTQALPALASQWNGLDAEELFVGSFGVPTLAFNDAEVAACSVIQGVGSELVLTLGTGLGCAFFVDGRLIPHIEMSHAPFKDGQTFDQVLGEHRRLFLDDAEWSRLVFDAVRALWPVFRWDHLFIGGGNAARITPEVRDALNQSRDAIEGIKPNTVKFIDNFAGLSGGNAAWELLTQADS